MKLFYCPECRQLVDIMRADGEVRYCYCESHCGKYLADKMTGVFTEGAIIVGIDNGTWIPAVQKYNRFNPDGEDPYPVRIDFFFTGWIPTIPGEVIFVDFPNEVHDFPMDYDAGNKHSTMPNSQPTKKPKVPPDRLIKEGEPPPRRCNKRVCYCGNIKCIPF